MDCKDLIDTMRGDSIGLIIARAHDAADTIETLLAERDAAIKSLHGVCGECEHRGSSFPRFPCDACSIRGTGLIDRWKWRGPQKESDGHGKA